MKLISKFINILVVVLILCSLIAAVGSAISNKPVLLTVIVSNSMYPVWERGDMVIIKNLKEEETVHHGDIVFFKTTKGDLADKGWIAHRIISGNADQGFITKGDANKYTDQESKGNVPIERKWIAGKAVTIGETPIVIPKIGYLSLWVEEFQTNQFILPAIALVIGILIAIGEFKSEKKQRKKIQGLELQLIYIIGGLTISIILGSTMLAAGEKINIIYEVSEHTQGVLMGSNVGILQIGDTVSQPLSELSNKGSFPSIAVITTNDKQIELSHTNMFLQKGQLINSTYTVHAEETGKYNSIVHVGMFYPLLPPSIVFFLAQKSYWLALAVVSLIPGLPLMLYPFIDDKMRRKMISVLRKRKNKLMSSLPF